MRREQIPGRVEVDRGLASLAPPFEDVRDQLVAAPFLDGAALALRPLEAGAGTSIAGGASEGAGAAGAAPGARSAASR